jgi:hypothetical protein
MDHREQHQMTATDEDEQYFTDHCALLGRVTVAWNDCHYLVLVIFHILSGVSWEKACAIFLALKSDHARREITLQLMKEVLSTENDQSIKDLGTRLLGQLGGLGGERNLATHTMWATVVPDRNIFPNASPEMRPHPSLPKAKNLQADFKSQFSNLALNLQDLFRDLMEYEAILFVHQQQRSAQSPTVST